MSTPKVSLTVRVNPEAKKKAQEVFNAQGITLSAAVNLFLVTAAEEGGFPFNPFSTTKSTASKDIDVAE